MVNNLGNHLPDDVTNLPVYLILRTPFLPHYQIVIFCASLHRPSLEPHWLASCRLNKCACESILKMIGCISYTIQSEMRYGTQEFKRRLNGSGKVDYFLIFCFKTTPALCYNTKDSLTPVRRLGLSKLVACQLTIT